MWCSDYFLPLFGSLFSRVTVGIVLSHKDRVIIVCQFMFMQIINKGSKHFDLFIIVEYNVRSTSLLYLVRLVAMKSRISLIDKHNNFFKFNHSKIKNALHKELLKNTISFSRC